jgi:hypothetical protein
MVRSHDQITSCLGSQGMLRPFTPLWGDGEAGIPKDFSQKN